MVAPVLTLTRPFPVLPAVPRPDWPRIWRGILEDPKSLTRMLQKRAILGYGTYGVVHEIAGAAVKIGHIDKEEVKIQEWVAERFPGRALPIWAYAPRVSVPRVITRQICPIHGFSEMDEENFSCHCGELMDILVMPVAKPVPIKAWKDQRVRRVVDAISTALLTECDFYWDATPRNLLYYQNRIVLADFGWEDVEGW